MTEDAAQVDKNMPPDLEKEPDPTAEDTATPESAPAVEDPGKEPAAEPTDESKTDDSDNVQKRINKVTADKHAERRRADKLEARVKELEGAPAPEEAEPKLEDFDYDESKHNAALAIYHGKKASVDAVSNYKAEQDKIAVENRQSEINQKFDERVVEFRKTNVDYDQTIGDLPQIPGDVMDEIMLNENGPQLAHYLGKHLDVAETITLMKLGEISAQLATIKPTKQLSAAPDPIEPVNSGGTLNKKMEDMEMEDIMALPPTTRN